jgi:hypothetical protein
MRGGGDRRERFQRSSRLDLLPDRSRRLAVEAHRDVDPAALVEHPHDRELLGLQAPHLGHHLTTACLQPLRGVGAQPVEAIGDVEHPHDQTMRL